jgi:ABC-type multidrug transport system ATPase subunit
MDEASLCDRVALMQKGNIMDIDTPQAIISKFGEPLWAIRTANMYQLQHDFKNWPQCKSAYLFGQYLHYTDVSANAYFGNIEKYLIEKGHTQIEITQILPNIEDCFMKLMSTQN